MSAPQTNLDKQRRVHKGPIIGITVVLILVLLGFVVWIFWEVDGSDSGDSNVPTEVPSQSDSVDQGAQIDPIETPLDSTVTPEN